nr:MAG TPA: transcriptional repressor [Caudoviricetes sp.]
MQIHKKVLVKKTRYDLNMSVENASRFEQLCEAYEMKKSDMADYIIESFCKGNPRYNQYLINLGVAKKKLQQKVEQDISLFEEAICK